MDFGIRYTFYAHQVKRDDAKNLELKSTALLFGPNKYRQWTILRGLADLPGSRSHHLQLEARRSVIPCRYSSAAIFSRCLGDTVGRDEFDWREFIECTVKERRQPTEDIFAINSEIVTFIFYSI